MVLTPDKCVFVSDKLFKTSKPGRYLIYLGFVVCTPDPSLCIVPEPTARSAVPDVSELGLAGRSEGY